MAQPRLSSDQRASYRSPRRRMGSRLIFILGITGGLHAYVGWRTFATPWLSDPLRAVGWVLLGLGFLSLPLSVLAMLYSDRALSRYLRATGHLWLGSFFILLSLAIFTDIVRLASRLSGAYAWLPLRHWATLQGDVIVLGGTALIVLAAITARRDPRVVRREVSISGLGPALNGFRIVQVSDIHLGHRGTDRAFLERLVDRILSLSPDVVAITGDIVEGSADSLREEIVPLARLRAPNGVLCVTGNHEYYHGGKEWERELEKLGLTVLTNEARIIERGGDRIAIGGVPDFAAAHFPDGQLARPELAFQEVPVGIPRVLLAHQPRAVFEAARAGVALQLSGHTHGGQILPFHWLVRLQQPTSGGLRRIGGVLIYTHPGTGYWGPRLRLGTRAEIAEIILVPG